MVDARSQRDLNLDGGLFDIEDVLDDQNKEKQTTTSQTSTLESNQKPGNSFFKYSNSIIIYLKFTKSYLVATLDFGCKGSIFRMNIFSSELALILSIIGMILSFCVNLIQCYGRKFSRTNTDTEEIPTNQTQNFGENSTQEQTIFLKPQPQSLMESTSYEAYFPERQKYENSFASLRNSGSKTGKLNLFLLIYLSIGKKSLKVLKTIAEKIPLHLLVK